MKLSTITRAIAYHTEEERLGSYIETTVRYVAMAICFVYAVGVTVKAFYENAFTFTTQLIKTIKSTYSTFTTQLQAKLDEYHFNDVIEASSVPSAPKG